MIPLPESFAKLACSVCKGPLPTDATIETRGKTIFRGGEPPITRLFRRGFCSYGCLSEWRRVTA